MRSEIKIDNSWTNYNLTLDRKGELAKESRITSFARKLFGLESSRDAKVLAHCVRKLELTEKEPVQIGVQADNQILKKNIVATRKLLARYKHLNRPKRKLPIFIRQIHSVATKIFNKIDSLLGGSRKDLHANYKLLKEHLVAMEVRLQETQKARLQDPDPQLLTKLVKTAKSWKGQQHCLPEKTLTDEDLTILSETARYPSFCKLMMRDRKLSARFFKWTLRGHLSPHIFIQYPKLRKNLEQGNLANYIGGIKPDALKITRQPLATDSTKEEQVVTLPIEGSETNILSDSERFIDLFGKIENQEVISFTQEKGITRWNSKTLAHYNPTTGEEEPINLDHPDLFSQLPMMKTVSSEYFENRFGQALPPHKCGYAAVAGRSEKGLESIGNHAHLEVFIPDGNGKHIVYPIGKYTLQFPRSSGDYLKTIGGTFQGVLLYPDRNLFQINREQKGNLWECDDEKFSRVKELVRQELKNSRDGKLIFQFFGDNCGSWVQDFVDTIEGPEAAPNLFRINMWDHKINNPIKYFYKPIKSLGLFPPLRKAVMRGFLSTLGGTRQMTDHRTGTPRRVNFFNTRHWQQQYSDLPAKLVHDAAERIRRQKELRAAAVA